MRKQKLIMLLYMFVMDDKKNVMIIKLFLRSICVCTLYYMILYLNAVL